MSSSEEGVAKRLKPSVSKGPFADGAEDFLLEPNIPLLSPERRSTASSGPAPSHHREDHPRGKHTSPAQDGPDAEERQTPSHPTPPHPVEASAPPQPKKHADKRAKPKKGVRYIPALDGLRALAVLAVIAYHTGLPGCEGGLMGVTVFFVISGYIVTKILLVEFARTGRISFKDFYIRRAKRLLPAILLVIVATGALCTLFSHPLLTKMRPEILPSLFFFNNWWQILNDASYFENIGLPSPLTHFWSLAIEEQFYLVLPATLFCVLKFGGKLRHRRNLSLFFLILAAASALEMTLLYDPTQDPTRVYYGTDTRAFSLLMGAFVAVLTTGAKDKLPRAFREACAIVGAVGVIICLGIMGGEDPFTYQGGMVICSALTAILVYGTLWKDSGFVAKVLSLKPFIWVGKRSYGLYLWHYPLVLLFTPTNGSFGLEGILMAAAILCTFICAELSYRFIENPIRYGIAKNKEDKGKHAPVEGEAATPALAGITAVHSAEAPIVEGLFDPATAQGDSVPEKEEGQEGIRAKIAKVIPIKPAAAAIAAILTAICIGGIILVPNTSALSSEGAAIIIRNSMAGEPLTGVVKLASGDEEIPTLTLEDEEEPEEEKPVYDILMIGDSVSLRAVPYFEERFPLGHIDALKNRRIEQGIEVYEQYAANGQVGGTVIFALGTNGHLTEEELHKAVETIGPDKQIYFVTIRSSDTDLTQENNRALQAVRDAYDNVHLIDWNSLTEMHGDYFDGDGTHLTAEAAKIYVQFIADVLQYPSAEEVLARQEAEQNGSGQEGEGSQSESATQSSSSAAQAAN